MTKFLESSFSVGLGSPEFRDGWEAIFGARKRVNAALAGDPAKVVMVLLNGATGTLKEVSEVLGKEYRQDDLVRCYEHLLAIYKTTPGKDSSCDMILDELDLLWSSFTEETIQKVGPR